ncbi:protein FAM32A [Condylostylus longicornis]|uniref:protein FAM32A n=1 Tax=Condylostylus longicornis TaxID=2530218 RepID=UPI00244DC7E0|nr:protein FAM32A [Condylostylus longicornis]XP_055383218.1 protein FAM32A [Condylostylus longicornis]XP_055383219.1 protein FAM32A [Condylostylus longicornis]
MSDDEYSTVARGKLKLKTDSENSIKKKKKSKKNKSKEREKIEKALKKDGGEQTFVNTPQSESNPSTRQLTKAEVSFKKQQEKMQKKRILEKATTTHKQRVEKFNEHLDSLTEHFDIPKVSWTK